MLLAGLGVIAMGAKHIEDAEGIAKIEYIQTKGTPWSWEEVGSDLDPFIKEQVNIGYGIIVGGGFLILFAILLMWGGNRTRRPKEVRIRYDNEG